MYSYTITYLILIVYQVELLQFFFYTCMFKVSKQWICIYYNECSEVSG